VAHNGNLNMPSPVKPLMFRQIKESVRGPAVALTESCINQLVARETRG
jgi:hypothetical protein